MKSAAIIAEYNPFHNGHEYMIKKARELIGADIIIILMSGNFVQRGAPAVCDKYLRTRMALSCGADIVFELPVKYALSNAEQFADGGVRLLCSLKGVDFLCFGSECGDITALTALSETIEEFSHSEPFKNDLTQKIKNGMSYPAAFCETALTFAGEDSNLLRSPNNLLGLEYLRALLRLKKEKNFCSMPYPITIKREGDSYTETVISAMPSATAVRNELLTGMTGITNAVPEKVLKLLSAESGKTFPVTEDDFNDILFCKLNCTSDNDLLKIPDANPDLIRKLIGFRRKKISISELIPMLKSKCFTYTAISRTLFKIILEPYYSNAVNCSFKHSKPYLRLLGFKKEASSFLRSLRYSETCSVITKPSDADLSDPSYMLDIYASGLYCQVYSNKYRTGFTEELKTGPVIMD